MSEELNLVVDLAVILVAAGVFTVISKALKQPLILGYIVAGFIVSPHLGLVPAFSSVESVNQWSEIGIIFLLFALGLEFSFKKLLKVGSSALIVTGCKFIGMFTIGLLLGKALGWGQMECIFLASMLPMSSTTIIIKAYDDLGIKDKRHCTILFGSLVVEDLIAVLLLVVLSALAVSNKFAGGEMLFNLGKLVFFIILWFLVGIYVLPTLFKKARKYMNDEILLIVSIGLCFGMVALATYVGFSSALGAFVMGSLLAETVEGERIEHLVGGIKDLFGAIFFVSVGMMLDPAVIAQYWPVILVITLVTVVGIVIFATFGGIIAGTGLDDSLNIGFSLAQLGEFAFIIAALGTSLGVVRDFIYPVVIAVSVITTFTTPYMIKLATPAARFAASSLPASLLEKINPKPEKAHPNAKAENNEWKNLLKSYVLRVVLYGVVLVAILIASSLYLDKLVRFILPFAGDSAVNVIGFVVTLAVMSPFLFGMAINNGSISGPARKLLKEKESNKWPILSLIIIRILIAEAFVLYAVFQRFTPSYWLILILIVAGLFFFLTAKMTVKKSSFIENRFITNLNEREELERKKAPVSAKVKDKLAHYNVSLCSKDISSDFSYAGKLLREMPFRHVSGVNVLKIQRGGRTILIPAGDERIFPGDRILVVGTDSQLKSFNEIMEESVVSTGEEKDIENFKVDNYTLNADSYIVGKSLRESAMRSTGCMVISVLRGEEFITNPGPEFVFNEGDIVWMAGPESACKWYI